MINNLNEQREMYEHSPLMVIGFDNHLQTSWETQSIRTAYPHLLETNGLISILPENNVQKLNQAIDLKEKNIVLGTNLQSARLYLYVFLEYENDCFAGGVAHCYDQAPKYHLDGQKAMILSQDYIAQRVSDILSLTSPEKLEKVGKAERNTLLRIRASGLKLLRFNRNILTYTDYSLRKNSATFCNLNLTELLSEMATELAGIFTRNIQFTFLPPMTDILMVGDRLLLIKMLAILIRDCAETSSKITLAADMQGSNAVITLRSDASELDERTDQAFNSDEVKIETCDGDHLEFYLVRPIVAEHGGSLSVRHEDDGNVFTIILPTGTDPRLSFRQYDTVYVGLSDVKVELFEYCENI